MKGRSYARALALAVAVLAGLFAPSRVPVSVAQPVMQEPYRHSVEITVTARKYSFSPARIEVNQDDIVKITLKAEDIPHSLTIDEYRIAKRAAPGQPANIEFRADRAGTFTFYCNLTADARCKEMRGELVVNAKK